MFDYSLKFNAVDKVTAKIAKINKKMAAMSVKARKISKQISERMKTAFSKINPKIRLEVNTKKAMQKIDDVQKKIQKKLNMKKIGRGGKELAGRGMQSLVTGAAVLAAVLQPLNVARKYELAFKDVKKAVDGTPEELARLRNEMKAFQGASFEELAAITAESGKMGFNAKNVMSFADSVIKGAKALDFDAELAVGQVGKILSMTNQMNTAVDSGKDIMNKVVNLENKLSGAKAAGILDIWKRSADLYSQLNFDNQTMSALSGFLEQSSVSSELGASGFKIMINRFKALESEFGFLNRIKTKGIAGLKDVMHEIAKMTPEEQIKKFGTEAMTLISKLQSKKNILKLDFAMEVSKNSAGAVLNEWEIARATFDARLNDSKKNFANTMDALGEPMKKIASDFLAAVNPVLEKITAWVDKNKELTASIMKWSAVIGGLLAALGVLAIVMGTIGMTMKALSPLLLIIKGKFGLLAAVTWLLNTALWANPMTWVVVAVVALIASLVALIYYWKDVYKWVGKTWDRFTGFISSFDSVKSWFGLEDTKTQNLNVDNTSKNHTRVDVNVSAASGAKAESTAKSTGRIKLRTIENGIAGV